MKKIIFYIFLCLSSIGLSQNVIQNTGNLKIFNNGQIGFHIDLANDGNFDQNEGLAGFYSDDTRTISGAFKPIFNDMEVVVTNDLFLDIAVGITNNSNFILGDVVTPRSAIDINLDFIQNAFYNGDSNLTKVDGYASIANKKSFTFPVGDADKIRPLLLDSETINNTAKSAYFFEDPNTPSTFTNTFNTDAKADILTAVSTYEFWDLDANIPSKVTLTWDQDSSIENFVNVIEDIRIVGWNKALNIWENLGNAAMAGNFNSGSVTSDTFVPDDYEIITFGTSLTALSANFDNYFVSPNGDGINDFLHFESISLAPDNNNLKIYNRWGRIVYDKEGYDNTFGGIANVKGVVTKGNALPDGVYFYILNLRDINIKHQGYIYLGYQNQ
ncbi:gliding motility-associated C-terminal domain-containing protein [Cellulophaga sp. 20_2_10]|uniref:gliding motility-associated C-terminal domain-containing protein n=1 Tax=Cellulophaga sp. 20_2_10 TaxID=2942476 RepID=UPI00201AF54A|nr:gliding motility-associated C-terminal domain-containing protein [Cellulophaga sp. 20_2_10]MCL5247100.1 gliding motility-associated C-terminal domain-containing protein [Cellulophaga sp. 20_2_10]